eukprot:TRINITY_DN14710_c0_g1_i1.p1 TRINITY_DN14710_c0_g1~~TRINITY_DN14710_c0_g1_i1.p1  ORF type:complete len:526 (+),score=51.91 TRINITY_DN14710_c0_g1_i1:109-1686(+)
MRKRYHSCSGVVCTVDGGSSYQKRKVWNVALGLLALQACLPVLFSCAVPETALIHPQKGAPIRLQNTRRVHPRCRVRQIGRAAIETSARDDGLQAEASTGDGIAIIAGTCIGGGFLALPTVTAPVGFLPSTAALVGVWVFLVLTGISYAEACIRISNASQAAGTEARDDSDLDDSDELIDAGTSIVSVTSRTLGKGFSLFCSLAFAAQMIAVITASVVKAGDIVACVTGLPYVFGCLMCSVVIGWCTFTTPTRLVEQTNTGLAVSLVAGFVMLVFSMLATMGGTGLSLAAQSSASIANWRLLWPLSYDSWVIPVFLNLLCFGQSIPLVVERLGTHRPNSIRTAIVAGSAVPLIMCITWCALSAAILGTASGSDLSDPVLRMLTQRPEVAVPVACIAVGAIGTTLIASYLSMGQFVTDILCETTGACSLRDRDISCACTVAVPALLACAGSGLYVPLLAFAGGFPTTLLYTVVPPLVLLLLRRARQGKKCKSSMLPFGSPLLALLMGVGISIVAANILLAFGIRLA